MVGRCSCDLDIILRSFLSFFPQVELIHLFRRYSYQSEYIVGTMCAQLLVQFYVLDSFETSQDWCFGHGLKKCMWLGYNLQIILSHFFYKLNLVIFQALLLSKCVQLVRATPPTILPSFISFIIKLKGHKFCLFTYDNLYRAANQRLGFSLQI